MARIFITGSTDGLGLLNARTLIGQGHDVVLHARTKSRAADVQDLGAQSIVIGDLASDAETRSVAEQVNALGRMDAVIHNAGVYLTDTRSPTPEGHARTLAVNVLAPYLLTALMERPGRLVYVTSGMHLGGRSDIPDMDWTSRRWPDVLSSSVDPGWVPTRMGGPGASDDLELGHDTQSWLAVSEDPAAAASGHYWHHRRHRAPAPEVTDPSFQDRLIDALGEMTGVRLFCTT